MEKKKKKSDSIYKLQKEWNWYKITSKNDGIKLSKKTPLDNPLIPWTVVTLLAVFDTKKEKLSPLA